MISKPRESIRLVLDCPLLQSKGTSPALSVLMKPAFIKDPIKLHRAQPSSTVNITLQKCTQGPDGGVGGVCWLHREGGLSSLQREGCWLTAGASLFGKIS